MMIALDISRAWRTASGMVKANRDVLAAIAGVFVLLPALAMAFFLPESRITPDMTPHDQSAMLVEEFSRDMPLMLPASLIQMVGLLTVIIVMADRARPTVGGAIRAGAVASLPYLGAQLLIGFGLAVAFSSVAALAGAIGIPAVASALVMAGIALAATIGLRMALVGPVIACEDQRNPVLAMRRSWDMTRGNGWRLASFLLLAALVFIVGSGLIMLFVGVILELAANGEVRHIVQGLISSVMTAIAIVYFGAILAAVHGQLSGPNAAERASTFD